jgi:Pentapeptide repeats (8 copies)
MRKFLRFGQYRFHVLTLIVIVLLLFIFYLKSGHLLNWADWTGLGQDKSITVSTERSPQNDIIKVTRIEHTQPAKTLWDWLNALGFPMSLAALGFWIQRVQQNRSVLQEAVDREIAHNHLNEEMLQTYLDRLSELLITQGLHGLKPGDFKYEIAMDVIRARTLSILRRLDGDRKGSVIRFLFDSDLIIRFHLNLAGADLCRANLRGANLRKARLASINLLKADLRGANLEGIDLAEANLVEANFSSDIQSADPWGETLQIQPHTNLRGSNLISANLRGANLSHVDLNGADLLAADLRNANLRNTNFAGVQNLTKNQVKEAANWWLAHYDADMCHDLGITGARRTPKDFSEFLRLGLQSSKNKRRQRYLR